MNKYETGPRTPSYNFAIQLCYSTFLHYFAIVLTARTSPERSPTKHRVHEQIAMHMGIKNSASKRVSESINK